MYTGFAVVALMETDSGGQCSPEPTPSLPLRVISHNEIGRISLIFDLELVN